MTDATVDMVVETLGRMIDLDAARQANAEAEAGRRPQLWDGLEELGLSRLALGEDEGGAGCGWPGLCEMTRAVARAGAPSPLPDEGAARALLAGAGLRQPEGMVLIADPRHSSLSLSGDTVSGSLARLPFGRHAGFVLAVAHEGDLARLALVDLSGGEWQAGRNLAGEPRDDWVVSRAGVEVAQLADPAGLLERAGALVRSAQISGAAERMLELAVGYAAERRQFGKPIAAFQAVQQMLARLAEESVAAAVAVRAAFAAAGSAEADVWAAVAKARTGDAAEEASAIAHQVHGAIGFTREHHLRYFSLRQLAWKHEFGAPEEWAERLARSVCDGGAAPWDRLVAIGSAVREGA